MVTPTSHPPIEGVPQVRSFNRLVTERIGALSDEYLARGRPLGASRLLWEVGVAGADVRDLRVRLGLDSGYLSRLLRNLEAEGLIEVVVSPEDRRVRLARLTSKGRMERVVLDRRSDELAESLLAPLSEGQRGRLVAAMAEVERLLTASAAELREVDPADPDVAHCLHEFFGELGRRAARPVTEEDVPTAEDMRAPHGVFVVAYLKGAPIGCAGLKQHDGFAEVKRMWVDAGARGLGLGRRLLDHVEGLARARGIEVLRLDTNEHLTEAIGMYRSAGYEQIPPYSDEPFATHWFEKRLGERGAGDDREGGAAN
ncbi:MAG: helix-turn-helix domain-containing GNAT family N-acetyltransferase [Dehalococcoidia bacterium]|nr:helix-turn-helix domain-containing GNAT family N-acetyltransferase [Dehalococcoidia bacterium]